MAERATKLAEAAIDMAEAATTKAETATNMKWALASGICPVSWENNGGKIPKPLSNITRGCLHEKCPLVSQKGPTWPHKL